MLVRLFGALCGAWRFDEAFALDLFDDATHVLDGACGHGAECARPLPRARMDAA